MARLFLILATLVSAAVVAPGAVASGGSFADPAGDATSGAPDLTAVSVDQSGGTVTFTLTPAGVAALGATHRYEVRIDSDNAVSTGSAGIDQVLVLHGPNREVSHWRWSGSAFELSAVAGLSATAAAPFRIAIAAASLGDPATIAFWVRSADLTTQGRDDAPNVDAYYVNLRAQGGPVQPGPVQPGPGQPGLPTPPAPPPFGDLPQPPPFATPPSGPGQTTGPQQPVKPGSPGQDPGTSPGTQSPGATLLRSKLTIVKRVTRRYLVASMSFRLPSGTPSNRIATTCRGKLAGRALRFVARRSGGTVTCSALLGRRGAGHVRIEMTVRIGNDVVSRSFSRQLRPA